MLGIHPIRWLRRGISRTVRRTVVVALLASTTGFGGINMHTDGALGRETAAFVNELVHPGQRP